MDQKVKGLIRICLEDSILTNVMDQDTANGLWQKLENMYLSKSLVNVLFGRKKLYNLRMHDGDSFATHLDEFNTLVNQLLAVDVQLIEVEKVDMRRRGSKGSYRDALIARGRNLDRNSNKFDDRGKSQGRSKGKDKACMAGSDQSWYVDIGASFHMTPHKEWFCEYETYNGGNVL
ncbi:hypothetical protein Patl1_17959 [Pistacia atlantica]|uniref:Uncharacterized protein n=1 Tax=Pistacia atlantica TaxID=434234 RepID=A0ACC1BXX2_9ROSI|nr:hypothetical protein Patl1_17959 [Pistacia atlantica]